jgi:hypothetical protein
MKDQGFLSINHLLANQRIYLVSPNSQIIICVLIVYELIAGHNLSDSTSIETINAGAEISWNHPRELIIHHINLFVKHYAHHPQAQDFMHIIFVESE